MLIAAGGIETPDDAWERLCAGATLVQAYTGFIYGGPRWPQRIHTGLARRARASGLTSIGDCAAGAVSAQGVPASEAPAGEAPAGEGDEVPADEAGPPTSV